MHRTLSAAVLLLLIAGNAFGQRGVATLNRPNIGASSSIGAEASPVVTRRLIAEMTTYPPGLSPTPDGLFLVGIHQETGDVEVREVATGAVRLLTHMEKPWESGMTDAARVSADGKRVAFNWWEPALGRYVLRVIDMDGSHPAIIYSDSATSYIWPESWTPRGDAILCWRIAADHIRHIVLVPVSGGPVRQLKTLDERGAGRMSLSPDGRYLAYDHPSRDDSNASDIYVLDLARGVESRVVENPADDDLLGWGPDDGHILFTSDRGGSPGAWLLPVAEGKARGAPVLVKGDFWRTSPVGFVPLTHSFLYTVQTGGTTLYSAPFDPATGRVTGTATTLTRTPLAKDYSGGPRFDTSPDGRYVAVAKGQPGGTRTIAIQSLETGESKEFNVPVSVTFLGEVRWVPGEAAVLLVAWNKRGTAFLRMDARTGKFSEVARVEAGWQAIVFDIPESGDFIIYQADDTSWKPNSKIRVVRQDLRSGKAEVVHQFPSNERPTSRIAISPDGSTIAYMRKSSSGQGNDLLSMPTRGGNPHLIATGQGRLTSWSKDGRWLIAARFGKDELGTLERVGASGGAFEPVGVDLRFFAGRVRFTADGRRVVYGAGRAVEELWAMEKILP